MKATLNQYIIKSDEERSKSPNQDNVSEVGSAYFTVNILESFDNRVNRNGSPSSSSSDSVNPHRGQPRRRKHGSKLHSPSQSTTYILSDHVSPFLSLSAVKALEYQRDVAGGMQASYNRVIAVSAKEVENNNKTTRKASRQLRTTK